MITTATIQCPHCGFKREEEMPLGYFETEYTCQNCHAKLTPKKGDCCVYCSYSSFICPPQQEKRNGCCGI